MIADAINSALADVWAKVVGLFTLSFLDPFWHWVPLAVLVIAAIVALCWFFGSWLSFLRPLGGGLILIIIALLAGFRKGEQEVRDFDKKKKRR